MDLEQRARRQNIRVIASEVVMVVAVILMVIILALIVSGYWLNSDFKVERQGMLQISSVPTGASVEVDGDSPWYQRTNTSKILSSEEHTIVLSKEDYDSWSKTINISEGLLYKLNYPRLFLKNRTKETVSDVSSFTYATISPNRKQLLAINNTTNWSLFNLDADTVKPTKINVSALFATESPATVSILNCSIISANWDESNEHVLLNINLDGTSEWVLLDIRNPAKSINLTREFVQDFDHVAIFNHSANILLAMSGSNLRKIDLDSKQLSSVIISGIESYDIYDSEIIFSNHERVGVIKNFSSEPEYLTDITSPTKVLFGRFYDDKYIFIIEDNSLAVYKKDDFTEIFSGTIGFTPEYVKVGPGAEFLFMSSGSNFATYDMESAKLSLWSADTVHFDWLDGHMLYVVKDGVLSVYDYDGLNHRVLASNVSERFPVTITDDKWLYYFSDGNLIREWLIKK